MARRFWGVGIAAALVGGVLTAVLAARPASANDIANAETVFNTDVAAFGLGGMRGIGTGSLTVSGVSGSVTRALLYWHGPTNSSDPGANASVTFNGAPITGTNIGLSDDNCWGFENSQAYRADVTTLVTGNGSYSLANFTKPGVEINGVSLLVFFDDGNPTNNRDVVLFHGNDSESENPFDAPGWNAVLSGINYSGGTAALTLHVSDGQDFPDDAVVVNGTTLEPDGPIFQGTTVPDAGSAGRTGGGLWDIKPYDVTALLVPGANTLTLTSGHLNDCLSLIVAAFDLPAGAAPRALSLEPARGDEGAWIPLVAELSSADSDEPASVEWSVVPGPGVDAGAVCTFSDSPPGLSQLNFLTDLFRVLPGGLGPRPEANSLETFIRCTDDGGFDVTVVVTDSRGMSARASAEVTVGNVAPTVLIESPVSGVEVLLGTAVEVAVAFSDPGTNDTHTGTIDWGDGTASALVVQEQFGAGFSRATHTYATTGRFVVTVHLRDDDTPPGQTGGAGARVTAAEQPRQLPSTAIAVVGEASGGPPPPARTAVQPPSGVDVPSLSLESVLRALADRLTQAVPTPQAPTATPRDR